MAYLKFTPASAYSVSVPYWFVTDYMPQALGGYVKVYLYILSHYQTKPQTPLSLEEAAGHLQMLYSEVLAALNYWHQLNVLCFKTHSQDDFELSFTFDKPSSTTKTAVKSSLDRPSVQPTRPSYSLQELNIYKSEDSSITRLFYIAEQYLGKMLSPSDQQILFGLYDWLHMPLDLIEYLIEFCASNQHTNLRYIEKVALAWVDSGITSIEQAKLKTKNDKNYYKILNELGLSSQTITSVQKEFMDKWLITYRLPLIIILEACKRTVAQTKNPSLRYVDSILTAWSKAQVTTLEDIVKLDENYMLSNQPKENVSPKQSSKSERFTTISSHNWDFDELEKLEREYVKRKLNGGI